MAFLLLFWAVWPKRWRLRMGLARIASSRQGVLYPFVWIFFLLFSLSFLFLGPPIPKQGRRKGRRRRRREYEIRTYNTIASPGLDRSPVSRYRIEYAVLLLRLLKKNSFFSTSLLFAFLSPSRTTDLFFFFQVSSFIRSDHPRTARRTVQIIFLMSRGRDTDTVWESGWLVVQYLCTYMDMYIGKAEMGWRDGEMEV